MFSDRTGVTLNAKLKIPRLLYDPKKHPYGLSYLSSTVPSRESPDARRKRKKEEEIKSAIEKQKFVDLELQQEQRYGNLDELELSTSVESSILGISLGLLR